MIVSFKTWTPSIRECSFVAPDSSIIGDVFAKSNSSIWYQVVLRADLARIEIGEGTNIQELSSIHVKHNSPVIIGDYVTVGHNSILHGCKIGNNTLIGMGSIILDDAQIGNQCIVGAGSLVTEGKVFPDGCLILGSPARVIRELTVDEKKSLLSSAEQYINLALENKSAVLGENNV
ncbi:MAG: gamma carbonic anhydrase family protein [Caldisericia bacterium]|nr:gamma carbonic anhydrase family protein [Caldisericia bacterium]